MGLRPAAPLSGPRALRLGAGLLAAVLLTATGCSADVPARRTTAARAPTTATTPTAPTAPTAPTSSTTSAAPAAAPAQPAWTVGASPLPLRADGFGRTERTPRALRVRRLPTVDLLPPPTDGRFHATVSAIDDATRRQMGETWSERCPVGLSDLRLLTMTFHGFDGRAHTGQMVVNASVADDVVGVFRTLYRARFPIEEMRLPTTADVRAAPTGDGNDTAAFVCRATRRQTTWSAHAYGLAIDLDPFMNPYRSTTRPPVVLPELAGSYLDRGWHRPGMILPDGVATRAFAEVGWTWGGDFHSVHDYMHFSATGR